MKWTDEQKDAIKVRDCNVLVAAAAGSGKTTVLVERIIQLITDPDRPTDIDRMLVTTFTEAAASKMKHEIAQALEKRLEQNPEDKNLAKQLVLLDNARICTVHSFCMRLVRAGFQKLDLEPDFGIGETGEMTLLLEKSVDMLFEELYENGDEGFLDLMESYATARSDSGLRTILLALYQFVSSLPFKADYFENVNALYDSIEPTTHPWFLQLGESALLRVESCIENLCRLHDSSVLYDGFIKYTQVLEDEIASLRQIAEVLRKGEFGRAGALARSMPSASPRTVKGDVNDVLKAQISEGRSVMKDLLTEIGTSCFPEDMERVLDDLCACGGKSRAIGAMVMRLDEIYLAEKKRRGVVDFSDLEHMAVALLCDRDEDGNYIPSADAKQIAEGLDYILVDEFQDTNDLQETIFSMISRGDNLFMVGDIKQSIYRFRHTNPYIFKRKKDSFSDTEGVNRRIIMAENFRSRASVLDGVNCIFERVASEKVGEITYDATERLNVGAKYPAADGVTSGGKVEVLVAAGALDGMSADEAEAHLIAQRIRALIEGGYMLYNPKKDEMYPASYKDIVILMRSYKTSAPLYVKVLESYGIPCYADSGGGYFENSEITLMLSLLKVIDNPLQDIELIAVLRSVLFGFDENALLQIRLEDQNAPFYACVCACAQGEGAIAQRCRAFQEKLERWRGYVQYMSTGELIGALYRETEFDLFSLGQPGGEYRYENLNMLFERARAFDASGFKGLFNFVNYIDGLKNAQTGDGDAKLISEAQDVVRIMSIHKSKGLEFGVVFVAHATKPFNNRDLSSVLLMHKELGLGFDVVDKENCYKYPSAAKLALRDKLRMENLSEELRILYVALTRAREKLIITGAKEKFDFAMYGTESVDGQLPLFATASARCYLDWILSAILMRTGGRSDIEINEDGIIETPLFYARAVTQASLEENVFVCETQAEAKTETADADVLDVMGYKYPHLADTVLPGKVTVTEVKRMVETQLDPEAVGWYDSDTLAEPKFGDEGLDGAGRGTVMHFVLQKLELQKPTDAQSIRAQVASLQAEGYLQPQEAASVSVSKLCGYFDSPLGRRMLQSNRVEREFPFEIPVPAAELFDGYAGDACVLVQGIADCFFEEADGLVLVDYKTDRAENADDVERIKARYEIQLAYYAQAIEKITGKRVKERYLYLFSLGEAVPM